MDQRRVLWSLSDLVDEDLSATIRLVRSVPLSLSDLSMKTSPRQFVWYARFYARFETSKVDMPIGSRRQTVQGLDMHWHRTGPG